MSDGDKDKSGKTTSSGRISPAHLTVPSTITGDSTASVARDGRPSRGASPVRLLTELTLKVKTQMSRVATIKSILDLISKGHEDISLSEVDIRSFQLKELHKAFIKKHPYFEVTWPAAFIDHENFATEVHQEEAKLVMMAKLSLSRLRHSLSTAEPQGSISSSSESRFQSKLPDITLPKFSGKYLKWLSFRELFDSLILRNERFSDIEKLHYLRGCMEGSPAQLIQSLPLTGDSLEASWDLLTSRYENKRLLIQAHLDKLFSISTPTSRDATSLTKMISTVSEANKALHTLGMSQDMWDCILVHHVSRHLDQVTREQWKTSLGASQEYPRFHQLEAFLTSRARP